MSNFINYLNTYVFETELPGSGETISFHPITTGQLKKLLLYESSNDSLTIEDALDELIQECVVKPKNFDITKLYIQDRFFLLVEIRKATRGNNYGFQSTCSKCESQSQQLIKLSDLAVKKLNKIENKITENKISKKPVIQQKKRSITEKTNIVEPEVFTNSSQDSWKVISINENISLKLKLVTRELQKEAVKIIDEKYKDINISDTKRTLELTTVLYALCIESIITPEGEEVVSLDEKIYLLDNIQQEEMEKISKWFDDNDFGIDFAFEVKCSHCGNIEKKEIPVENFFY